MNVHDSEKMAGILQSDNYEETAEPDNADIIIFNTCSIRQKAEQKFFSLLGKMKPLKKRRPDLKIAVAGCIAQQEKEAIFKRAPHVDYVIGPQNIHTIKNIIDNSSGTVIVRDNPLLTDFDFPACRKSSVSAWVNIVYGCNNFCSYCVVPYTRGRELSRPAYGILKEIQDLAGKGYKEVILLGQNVNSYKSSLDFTGLLCEINEIKGISRIRFVTSHPKDLTEDLMYAMRDLEKVCEHIHLPLQSGSSRVLKLMNRKYTYDEYLKNVTRIREIVPDISITSDIIAGFPQETDEDHMNTISAMKEIGFDGIFAFNYSSRAGTKASVMKNQVPDEVKSARLYEILALQNEITDRKNKLLDGTLQEVLVEGPVENDIDRQTGRTRTNKIVNFTTDHDTNIGDIANVAISNTYRHSLEGIHYIPDTL
jgi:tRNA-2-methylthio-N6-dimethylallyladenosine synthase